MYVVSMYVLFCHVMYGCFVCILYAYICMYLCICIFACVCAYMHVHLCAYMLVPMYVLVQTFVCMILIYLIVCLVDI